MRKLFLAGNWKMNKLFKEAKSFFDQLDQLEWEENIEVGIFVPAVYGMSLAQHELAKRISLGLQNVHFATAGAYTGEWSTEMIKDIGMSWVLIGHSERRQYFEETNQTVNLKIKKALADGLKIIFCCGETLEERQQKKEKEILTKQITEGLKDIPKEEMKHITIAYEPVWAIGTGVTASKEDADEMCGFVRSLAENLFNGEIADNLCIQYGGSVKPENTKELLSMPNIDGALIGGASLDFESFRKIIEIGGDLSEK